MSFCTAEVRGSIPLGSTSGKCEFAGKTCENHEGSELLLFRGLGVLGVDLFSTREVSAAWALAVMFVFTASAHFTKTKEDLIGMVPEAFPSPRLLVYFTGVLEILGAVGLLVPASRSLASVGLVLLLVAMLPANVNAARKGIPLRAKVPTPLWIRGPMQLLFIGMTFWVALP